MEFYKKLKSFLGLPSGYNQKHDLNDDTRDSVRNDVHPETPQDWHGDEYERFGFNMFSNPLEMHRYFEHQMNEIIKTFGIFHGDDSFFNKGGESFFGKIEEPGFGDFPYNFDSSQFPKIEDFRSSDESSSGNLRDKYLKPGYEQAKSNEPIQDVDLDGRFDMGDLDTVLKGKPSQVQPRVFTYGQSVTSKSIRHSDGSTETHRTVTDQHGNQETTIIKTLGDKEYKRVTKIDKNGQQEVIENFVNLEENEKDKFLKGSGYYNKLPDSDQKPPNWFPFDRFFK